MEYKKDLATIAIRTSKGVYAIQVMCNGDLDNLGKNLKENYSKNYLNIIKMMKKGSLVFLGKNLKKYSDEEPDGTLDLKTQKVDKPMKVYDSLGQLVFTETKSNHLYFWDIDKWYYMRIKENYPYNSIFRELNLL